MEDPRPSETFGEAARQVGIGLGGFDDLVLTLIPRRLEQPSSELDERLVSVVSALREIREDVV